MFLVRSFLRPDPDEIHTRMLSLWSILHLLKSRLAQILSTKYGFGVWEENDEVGCSCSKYFFSIY